MKKCPRCQAEKPLDAFNKRSAAKDGLQTYCKACSNASRDEWRQENPGVYHTKIEHIRAWEAANPERVADQRRKANGLRRARIHGATIGDIPSYKELMVALGGKCAECGTTERLEIDHIIPLAKGGSHSVDNFQILCRHHNAVKSARLPA